MFHNPAGNHHPTPPNQKMLSGDVSPAHRGRKRAVENTPSEAHRRIWQSRGCRESGNEEGIPLRIGKGQGAKETPGQGLPRGASFRAGGGATPPQPGRPPLSHLPPTSAPPGGEPASPLLPPPPPPPPEQKLCVSNGNRAALQLPPPYPRLAAAPISASLVPPAGKGLRVSRASHTSAAARAGNRRARS